MVGIAELYLHLAQQALFFHVHGVQAVDQNVADVRIAEQRPQRPETAHLVHQPCRQLGVGTANGWRVRQRLQLPDHGHHQVREAFFVEPGGMFGIEPFEDAAVIPRHRQFETIAHSRFRGDRAQIRLTRTLIGAAALLANGLGH